MDSSTDTPSNLNATECQIFNGNTAQCDAVIVVRITVSVLSLLGCMFVIFIIWTFAKYAAFAQRLILYLSISAVLSSIAYLAADDSYRACAFLGFLLNFADYMVLLWVCCITFNLYMNIIWMKYTGKFEWLYVTLVIGVSLVVSCLPFIDNHYGPAGLWCWIKHDWAWRFGIFYLPVIILNCVMICVYCYIMIVVSRKLLAWEGSNLPDIYQKKNAIKTDIQLLRRYPLIYILCFIFPLIHRIYDSVNPDQPSFALTLLHTMTSPLPGALNAIVFALDKNTVSNLTWTQIKLSVWSRCMFSRQRDSGIQEYHPDTTQDAHMGQTTEPESIEATGFPAHSSSSSNIVEHYQNKDESYI